MHAAPDGPPRGSTRLPLRQGQRPCVLDGRTSQLQPPKYQLMFFAGRSDVGAGMRRAPVRGAELVPAGYAPASDYKKDDGDGRAPAFDDSLFPLIGVKNRTAVRLPRAAQLPSRRSPVRLCPDGCAWAFVRHAQVMGGIIVLMLILLGLSYTTFGAGAVEDDWKPQSRLQVTGHRQADLYEDLALANRAQARDGRGLPPGGEGNGVYAPVPSGQRLRRRDASGAGVGEDEQAFLKMAEQQEREAAKEFGFAEPGAGRSRADVEADGDDDEDEDDQETGAVAVSQSPDLGAWRALSLSLAQPMLVLPLATDLQPTVVPAQPVRLSGRERQERGD